MLRGVGVYLLEFLAKISGEVSEVYAFDLVDDGGESVALLHGPSILDLGAFFLLESVVDFFAESNEGDDVAGAETEAHLLLDDCRLALLL